MIASLDITNWTIRYPMDQHTPIMNCMYKCMLDIVLLCTFIAMDTFSHINIQFMFENTEMLSKAYVLDLSCDTEKHW